MSEAGGARDINVGDALTLHVERHGRGAPLLLLHGFTGSGRSWDEIIPALCDRFTVIAMDLPGHGRSSAPAEPARYALARVADDLARVLDTLQLERAAVLGYSLGGRTALRFALAHPERVTHLVLESASPGIDDPAERRTRRGADEALAARIERDGIAAFVDEWEQLPLWASQGQLPPERRAALRAARLRNDPRGLANSLRGAGAAAAESVLARLDTLCVPTLLVAGALDPKYVTLGRRMAEALPAATLRVIPGAGHTVHLEQPARFAEAVASFLAGPITSARDARQPPPAAPAH